jgi:hypothetical protein
MTQDAIVIPLSKSKLVLPVVGATAFVLLSVFVYLNAYQLPQYNPTLIMAIAIVGMLSSALFAVYGVRKLLDTSPGLIIDSGGLVDNSSAISMGRIPWSDITSFKVTVIGIQRFLSIRVRNSKEYLQRVSVLKRPFAVLNTKLYGTPIHITANTLKMDFDELVARITEAHKNYVGS